MVDENRTRRPHPVLIIMATIGGISLIVAIVFMLLVGMAVNSFTKVSFSSVGSGFGKVVTNPAIAGIKLDETISSDFTNIVLNKFKEAEQDKQYKAILLEVNSPGGSVVASQEIFDTISAIKSAKPVVVYVREMAASGSYYASASADFIVANRSSMVGSIGVIISSMEASQLFDWLKVKPVTLKTGKLKDAGSINRPWSDEDKAYLQKMINDTRDQFAGDVKKARNLSDVTMAYMSDGRVVLGTEALQLKLVDAIGTKHDAIKKAAELAKMTTPNPELIYIEDDNNFEEKLSELLRGQTTNFLKESFKYLLTQ